MSNAPKKGLDERGVLVVFEGPTGVGKTTFAHRFCEAIGWSLELGKDEENPFLEKYYGSGEACAESMELWFLENRYASLRDCILPQLSKGINVVSDYHLIRNIIFSKFTLSKGQYDLFQEKFDKLIAVCPQPDVLIHLDASGEEIRRRIELRGRTYERELSAFYLENLASEFRLYIDHFRQTNNIATVRFRMDAFDIVRNPELIRVVKDQIILAVETIKRAI